MKMKKHKILMIIAILISLFGLGYMGFSHGKGYENNYGSWVVLLGLFLSIFSQFLEKKDKENKT